MAMLACVAALPMTSGAQETVPQIKPATLTRAEVVADLALWRRAGVDRVAPLWLSHGLEPDAYQSAQQEYLRLRNTEEFQKEVQKVREGQ